MKALGRHVLAEIYQCDFDILNDIKKVEEFMVKAALEAGAEVREYVFHKFRIAFGNPYLARIRLRSSRRIHLRGQC
jgi:S-adenosylmethionine/arginine decarboxylase-like enzyme